MRIRPFLVLVLAAMPAACGRSPDEALAQSAAPPPAAALAPLSGENTAGQALELLAAELDAVLQSELADPDAILRAEAISDRLLETRRPFAWIPDERYFVDSLLRQIQAEADRILAQVQSGVPRDTVLAAVRGLAAEVAQLREDLAGPGAPAPPSLQQLLSGDTAAQPRAAQPRAPQPRTPPDTL